MTTNEEIQGYAKKLYQENKLKSCILLCATLLSLEYLRKLQPESRFLYVPDLARNLENRLNIILPDFFSKDELWIDSSSFILGYLECWHTDPKFGRAIMREFQPVLVSPLGYIQSNQIKTLQQAEDFMIGVAAYKSASNLSEEMRIPNLFADDLKELLGLIKIEPIFDQYDLKPIASVFSALPFMDKSIEAVSVENIFSNIKIKSNKNKTKKKQIQNLLGHLPEDIVNFKITCAECSAKFSPNWFKIKSEPVIPIKPNDHEGEGRWIPIKDYEICPSCDEITYFELPVVKMQSKVMLFGDEAYREEQQKFVYTYSLVGADFKIIPQLDESLRKLKLELSPAECPNSWAFHMKELWSGDHRKKHRIFCNWDSEKVKLAIHSLFQLIQSHSEHIFMYNIALNAQGSMKSKGFNSKPALERPQDNAYILLVTYVIHALTAAKAQPVLTFDAEKKTKTEQVIQAWARDAFSGVQHCTLYPFLSHGIEVPEPIFVQPASQPCLELADFISFIIARFYFKRWQGHEIEEVLNPQNLGNVMYLGFDKTGDLVFSRNDSYPWELFDGS